MASGEPLLKTEEGQEKKVRKSSLFNFATAYNYADNEDVGKVVQYEALGGTSAPGQANLERATKQAKYTKLSMFYGKDDYVEELKNRESKEGIAYSHKVAKKEAQNSEIAGAHAASPDGGKPAEAPAAAASAGGGRGAQRSARTGRMYPTPNKDEMMKHDSIRFLFTKMTNDNMLYLWDVYTALFITQCTLVVLYATVFLRFLDYWTATLLFGIPMFWLCIQNVYCLHDVIHGASFPPHDWQAYITHCWADFFSCSWEDVVMEHMKHHSSTPDLLEHGEFGWDPASWLYVLQERWFTLPLVPFWHFIGASDTGGLFAILWYCNFPESFSQLYSKWFWQRMKHHTFLALLWGGVWLLGTYPLGRPLSEGWRVVMPVTVAARCGFSAAWMVFTNFNHSHFWNRWLARAPERNYPLICFFMSMLLGGPARFNEMLFHDLHHGFPNAVGALSMRGRFNGWRVVHKAAMEALSYGIYKPQEMEATTAMQRMQQKRSQVFKASNKPL